MKASTILKRAAKFVEKGHYVGGCQAIWHAYCSVPYFRRCLDDHDRAERIFHEYFYNKKNALAYGEYWWPYTEKHGPRIIGLYLAAAIAKSEGD